MNGRSFRFADLYSKRLEPEWKDAYNDMLKERSDSAEPWLVASLYDDVELTKVLIDLDSDLTDGFLWMEVALMVNAYLMLEEVAIVNKIDKEEFQKALNKDSEALLMIILNGGLNLIRRSVEVYNSKIFPESPITQAFMEDVANGRLLILPRVINKLVESLGYVPREMFDASKVELIRNISVHPTNKTLLEAPNILDRYKDYVK